MGLTDIFQQRFTELDAAYAALPRLSSDLSGKYVPSGDWKKWATSVQGLVRAVFGEGSPHYENFVTSFKGCNGADYDIDELGGVFQSAKEDFEGGYVFNVDLRVSGEVFGDFVAMAKLALAEGQVPVAAVLSCAALEDALKRFASANELNVDDKSMAEVVNALKSKGLVSGAQKTLLGSMPKIRNLAMHGEWSKLSALDISSVIGFVEQFLLSKFSGP